MVHPQCFRPTGCADFVPTCIDHGSQFGPANYERFGDVVKKASYWVREQQGIRVTNVQSIDYKLTHGSGKSTSHVILTCACIFIYFVLLFNINTLLYYCVYEYMYGF